MNKGCLLKSKKLCAYSLGICVAVVIFVALTRLCLTEWWESSNIMDMVQALASFATCIALCVQIYSFNRERFDSNFYHLLDYHCNILERMRIFTRSVLQEDGIPTIIYEKEKCFQCLRIEMRNILISLNYERYLEKWDNEKDWDNRTNTETYYEGNLGKLKKFFVEDQIKITNAVFGITQEDWNNFHDKKQDANIYCYTILCRRFREFEHYVMSLQYLLKVVCRKRCKSERKEYAEYVAAAMPHDAHWLVYIHAQRFPTFRQYYIKSGMSEIYEERYNKDKNEQR